jgi:tRNA(fMet)-specific endonuclease VapC
LRYLIDTSTLSAVIAARPNRHVLRRLTQYGQHSAIASVVWHELVYGCERLERGRRRAELEAFLRDVVKPSFPILPYDENAAAWQGTERVRQERAGKPRPFVDGQIAAIAHTNDLTLVTANTKDFTHFRGLRVEDWSRER